MLPSRVDRRLRIPNIAQVAWLRRRCEFLVHITCRVGPNDAHHLFFGVVERCARSPRTEVRYIGTQRAKIDRSLIATAALPFRRRTWCASVAHSGLPRAAAPCVRQVRAFARSPSPRRTPAPPERSGSQAPDLSWGGPPPQVTGRGCTAADSRRDRRRGASVETPKPSSTRIPSRAGSVLPWGSSRC
jgi:hypothetical protein